MNSEIIETYWNVNEVNPLEKGGIQLEIIETYWNVKFCILFIHADLDNEIIETYWNVNRGGESMAALTKLK